MAFEYLYLAAFIAGLYDVDLLHSRIPELAAGHAL
jgi:hypothetical protein